MDQETKLNQKLIEAHEVHRKQCQLCGDGKECTTGEALREDAYPQNEPQSISDFERGFRDATNQLFAALMSRLHLSAFDNRDGSRHFSVSENSISEAFKEVGIPASVSPSELKFAAHTKAVGEFLSEMAEIYSLDALDPAPTNVQETTAALLRVSREIREKMNAHSDSPSVGEVERCQKCAEHEEREAAVCPEDVGCIEYIGILERQRDSLRAVVAQNQTGLNLLRQLVGGKNALRQLNVFWCNDGEHAPDCKCFWEQCEQWATSDDLGEQAEKNSG